MKRTWKRDQEILVHFKRILGEDNKLGRITKNDLIRYQKKRLEEGRAPASINRELACFKHFINLAIDMEVINGPNPVKKVKPLEQPDNLDRILSPKEEKRLFRELKYNQAVIVDLALNTAMRANELINLRWAWIDFKNEWITVPVTYTKQKRTKRVELNAYIKRVLLDHQKETGHTDHVILNESGEPYRGVTSLRFFKRACKRAGIEGVTFHTLRHTAITRMLSQNSPIDSVARMAGHFQISTTMKYAHRNPSDKKAVESLEVFRKEPLYSHTTSHTKTSSS